MATAKKKESNRTTRARRSAATMPSTPSRAPSGQRDRKKIKTKDNILKAALALFRRQGFYRTTTKQISTKARIAEGTLFNYFKTKEDLALYFFEKELEATIAWFESENQFEEAPISEKIFAIVHHHLEQITPYEDFIEAVYLRALHPRSKLNPLSLDSQAVNLEYLRFIRGILEKAEEDGELASAGDFGAYAVGFFHVGMITYWLHDHSEGKEDTLALLDRSLKLAESILQQGEWEW